VDIEGKGKGPKGGVEVDVKVEGDVNTKGPKGSGEIDVDVEGKGPKGRVEVDVDIEGKGGFPNWWQNEGIKI